VSAHRTFSDPGPLGPSSCPEEMDGLTIWYLVFRTLYPTTRV